MREYKRERNTLSSQLEELNNRSAYHDEHIRIIDSWFLQVRLIPFVAHAGSYLSL